jgi:glycosyltransferase involved in cell wall biosynthesis
MASAQIPKAWEDPDLKECWTGLTDCVCFLMGIFQHKKELMEPFLFYLAIATLLLSLAFGIELVVGNRTIRFLKDISPSSRFPVSKVSIIIPARNEEKHVAEALQSILGQDYKNLEIIVIDDRSIDQTPAILNRMAQSHPTLNVVHITELPQGWLGKNYALFLGAQQATGEYLLFTDADVVMHPSTLSRAIHYMVEKQLDHLTLGPVIRMPGLHLQMFAGAFVIFLALYSMPWKAKNLKSNKYIGIGAFNLLKANVYRAIGTHQAIAMRPDDDIKLGKLIKKHGYKQEVLFGEKMIHVDWYDSLREVIVGLMKNTFAVFDYKISVVIAVSISLLLLVVWPFLGIFLTKGIAQILNFIIVLIILLLYWETMRSHDVKRWLGIGFPISTCLFIYIMWRAMLTAVINKSITWRGTHYSLAELKSNKV